MNHKIVIASNFDSETYDEQFLNVPVRNEHVGLLLVNALNQYCSTSDSQHYYKLVDDTYKLHKFEP